MIHYASAEDDLPGNPVGRWQSAFTDLVMAWKKALAAGNDPARLVAELRNAAEPDSAADFTDFQQPAGSVPPTYADDLPASPPARAAWPLSAQASPPQPWFVLTAQPGDVLAPEPAPVAPAPAGAPEPPGQRPRSAATPRWDADRRTLFVDRRVVKRYRQPAEKQVLILTAFEELGWPPRIDDPLPRERGKEPKKRLRDVIRSLNERQKHPLITFEADGTGTGVLWRLQG